MLACVAVPGGSRASAIAGLMLVCLTGLGGTVSAQAPQNQDNIHAIPKLVSPFGVLHGLRGDTHCADQPVGFLQMRDGFEDYPVGVSLSNGALALIDNGNDDDDSFSGPPGFEWGSNEVIGLGFPETQIVDLGDIPIAAPGGLSNGSRALRVRTNQYLSGSFYAAARIRLPWMLTPTAGVNARFGADVFVSTLDEVYAIDIASGFLGRLLWGGECTASHADCAYVGGPGMPRIHFSQLVYDPIAHPAQGRFVLARYCTQTETGEAIAGCNTPGGASQGDPVLVPVGQWFRFITEQTLDDRLIWRLDTHDGSGEFHMGEHDMMFPGQYGYRIDAHSGFSVVDAFMLLDNLEASGEGYSAPSTPPRTFPYLDTLDGLLLGPLVFQSESYTVSPDANPVVVIDDTSAPGTCDRVIAADGQPAEGAREECIARLPAGISMQSQAPRFGADLRIVGETVRGMRIDFGPTVIDRIFIGRTTANGFDPSIFVQINRDYDPFAPDAAPPVVGVDVEDTGVDWPDDGQFHRITYTHAQDNTSHLHLDGQRIHTWVGGPINVREIAFESHGGDDENSIFRVNNISADLLECPGDINGDGAVGFSDLNRLLQHFGSVGLVGDVDGDFLASFSDLNIILNNFGVVCQEY